MASAQQFMIRCEQHITQQLELIRDFREDVREFEVRGSADWLKTTDLTDKPYDADQFVAAIQTVAAFLDRLDPSTGNDDERAAKAARLANLYRLKQ